MRPTANASWQCGNLSRSCAVRARPCPRRIRYSTLQTCCGRCYREAEPGHQIPNTSGQDLSGSDLTRKTRTSLSDWSPNAHVRAGPCHRPYHHRHPPPTQGYRRGASRTAVVTCPATDRKSGPAPSSQSTRCTLLPAAKKRSLRAGADLVAGSHPMKRGRSPRTLVWERTLRRGGWRLKRALIGLPWLR